MGSESKAEHGSSERSCVLLLELPTLRGSALCIFRREMIRVSTGKKSAFRSEADQALWSARTGAWGVAASQGTCDLLGGKEVATPRERIAMLKIEEILRLRYEAGRTQREIARSCGLVQSSVHDVLERQGGGAGLAAARGTDCARTARATAPAAPQTDYETIATSSRGNEL